MKSRKQLKHARKLQAQGLLPPEWTDEDLAELGQEDFALAESLAQSICQDRQSRQQILMLAAGFFLGISLSGCDD